MKLKRVVLNIAIGIFMVFSLSFATSQTYAYWSSGFAADSEATSDTVTVGTWTQAFPWDANETYAVGDQVTNNGTTYQAKKANPTKEPGVDGGWNSQWLVVN